MATTIETIGAHPAPRSHRYYVAMAIGFIVLIVAAFSERYYWRLTGIEPATPLVHVHAATFSAWFLLLFAQTGLVAVNRRDLHRRLGLAGAALVPLVLGTSVMTSVAAARAGWNPAGLPGGVQGFLVLGIVDTLLFAGFATAAIRYRHRSEVHKRLIVLASASLLWAAVSRLPSATGFVVVPNPPPLAGLIACFVLFAGLALSGPTYDFCTGRRVSRLELCGGVLIVAGRPIARLIAGTDVWQAIGARLIS